MPRTPRGWLAHRTSRPSWWRRELPGGLPDPDDAPLEDTARREIDEESGLDVTVGCFVTALLHRAAGGLPPVALIVMRVRVVGPISPTTSDERSRMGFFDVDSLPSPLPDTHRSAITPAAEASTRGAGR